MPKFIKLQALSNRQLKTALTDTLEDLAEVLIEVRRRDTHRPAPASGPSPEQVEQTLTHLSQATRRTRTPKPSPAPAPAERLFATDTRGEKADAFDRVTA
jgi:hypothetical protein